MELNVESLRKALSNVRPAVPPRSPRPILTNVLLADGSVTATDLELRITVPIEGVEGEIALPYERLKSIVMNATGCETISLRSDGSRCHITAGTGKWILPTENADEFPAAAPVTAKPIARLPADQFLAMASTVIAVPDKAESKYAGVLVEFREGSLCLVATDGKRLAVAECEIDQATDDASAFVPKRAMEALMAAAAGRDVIQLETTGTEFIATADDVLVCSLLLSAKFPNWRAFEPDHDTAPTFVTASELRSSCLMASICTSETSKGTRWAIADKGITMTAKSSECGESTAVCSIAECGHKCEFTINPQFAIGWLSTVDPAETVSIEAKDQHSPILFRTETCRVTVMPLEGD
jgi:DNA polymerase-3 subunit beta